MYQVRRPVAPSHYLVLTRYFQLADALIRCGVPQTDIGVIALYRQQIKLIARKLVPYPDVEVLTADRSQGRDKECILMSLTRSNTEGQVRTMSLYSRDDPVLNLDLWPQVGDLLKDWRRINVCLTRAKSKLVVFGSRSTLSNLPLLERFFSIVQERKWIYALPPRAHETHGEEALSPLKRRGWVEPEGGKKRRVGPEGLVLSQAMLRDVVNSV